MSSINQLEETVQSLINLVEELYDDEGDRGMYAKYMESADMSRLIKPRLDKAKEILKQ